MAPETEIFQRMFDTIINFTQSKVPCKYVIIYVFQESQSCNRGF